MRNVSSKRFGARGVIVAASATITLLVASAVPASAAPTPDLTKAVHFLATTTTASGATDGSGTSLTKDGYYESFPGFGDLGLTMDGALALAAAGSDNNDLRKVVDFIDQRKKDAGGRTIDDYTLIGTQFVSGGSIGKEALLAEVTGRDPRTFGGHDLIAALDGIVCTKPVTNVCADAGNYAGATSTFSQALGVIAQLRAGDANNAAETIAYLEGLQNSAGAWPSLLPSSHDSDVDSTAIAAMALALLPGDATASAAATKAEAWIASQQMPDGSFNGAAGESSNSTALAIQGMTLAGATYASQIQKAVVFLAGQQNADGGFAAGPSGQSGSDVRASTQVVGGIKGSSFGTLSDVIGKTPTGPSTTTTTTLAPSSSTTTTPTVAPLGTSSTTSTTDSTVEATAAETLPRTGAGMDRMLQSAAALLTIGFAAIGAGRRRRDT